MPVFSALILISENHWSMDGFIHAKAYFNMWSTRIQ